MLFNAVALTTFVLCTTIHSSTGRPATTAAHLFFILDPTFMHHNTTKQAQKNGTVSRLTIKVTAQKSRKIFIHDQIALELQHHTQKCAQKLEKVCKLESTSFQISTDLTKSQWDSWLA